VLLWIIVTLQLLTLAIALYGARQGHRATRRMKSLRSLVQDAGVAATQQNEHLAQLYRKLDLQPGSLPPTRGWAASPDFLCIVADVILARKPQVIVECGSGVSTLVVARCLQKQGGGSVISLDHESQFAERTQESLAELGLQDYAEVHHAPLTTLNIGGEARRWYDVTSADLPERIDLVIVDGPPKSIGPLARYPVGPLLIPRLADNGVMLFDDTRRAEEQKIVERLVAECPGLDRIDHPAEKGCVELIKRRTSIRGA
jgi:predicted O-methyltransferase YrrM